MNVSEQVLNFPCQEHALMGILSAPENANTTTGMIIIVGGPQYRVGAHRMFVRLARYMATHGVPCLRFDVRGMGDSSGQIIDYVDNQSDIAAAIDAFQSAMPQIQNIVLWGLCDGASSACLYQPDDQRVAGAILTNPWVSTKEGEAKTLLRHYYLQRIFQKSFWRKLFSGQLKVIYSATNFFRSILLASRSKTEKADLSPADQMAEALMQGNRPFSLILSEKDFVAQEFRDRALTQPRWRQAISQLQVSRLEIEDADHTLASSQWMEQAAEFSFSAVAQLTAPSKHRPTNQESTL